MTPPRGRVTGPGETRGGRAGASDARGIPVVAVVGATGTGKSAAALDLAEALAARGAAAEIVGADAMQLYRGLDVGTAKMPLAERRGIPHHLIDVLDIVDEASVAAYQRDARAAIEQIAARGAVPILVGGSGLYVSAALFPLRFPGTDRALRTALEAELERDGRDALVARLAALDPALAAEVDVRNPRRLVRALEVALLARRERTLAPGPSAPSPPTRVADDVPGRLPVHPDPVRPTSILELRVERPRLVARLDARVERMWEEGLLAETRAALAAGLDRSPTAARAIGYAQAASELAGRMTRAEAIAAAQHATRRYARRQVSWFGRYDARRVDAEDPAALGAAIATLAGEVDAAAG